MHALRRKGKNSIFISKSKSCFAIEFDLPIGFASDLMTGSEIGVATTLTLLYI